MRSSYLPQSTADWVAASVVVASTVGLVLVIAAI